MNNSPVYIFIVINEGNDSPADELAVYVKLNSESSKHYL